MSGEIGVARRAAGAMILENRSRSRPRGATPRTGRPVTVVLVHDSDRDEVEALDAGADDFMSKPFTINEGQTECRQES
jgi:DNA-binding response OmpR family regulator